MIFYMDTHEKFSTKSGKISNIKIPKIRGNMAQEIMGFQMFFPLNLRTSCIYSLQFQEATTFPWFLGVRFDYLDYGDLYDPCWKLHISTVKRNGRGTWKENHPFPMETGQSKTGAATMGKKGMYMQALLSDYGYVLYTE